MIYILIIFLIIMVINLCAQGIKRARLIREIMEYEKHFTKEQEQNNKEIFDSFRNAANKEEKEEII